MKTKTPYRILFWVILSLCLVFLSKSTSVEADLGGSKVIFVTSPEGTTGAACYIPDRYQRLCFSLYSTTTDGEDVTAVYIKFPTNWTVDTYNTQTVSKSCSAGGSFVSGWQGVGPYGLEIHEGRTQTEGENCTAVYCWSVKAAADATGDATVPWIWFNNSVDTSVGPHHPCSNDDYFTNVTNITCDEHDANPPATVPICEYTTINITPETLPHAIAGKYYKQQLSPTNPDPEKPDYWYTRSSTMPDGFILFSNTGEIQWNEPAIGEYTFTVYVTGPGWSEGSRQYTITVDPELIFTPDPLLYARANSAYNQPITVSGGQGPYTLNYISGTLPTGISFADPAFIGTPKIPGTYPDIVIQAVDNNGVSQTHKFTITVLPEHLFTWTPLTSASGESTTFTASAGFDYYEWYYATQPGGECDAKFWGSGDARFADIIFHGKGDHKVCLTLFEYSSTEQTIQDIQFVTITNGPPDMNGFYIDPYPSFVGQQVEATVYFYDDDGPGTFSCEIDWGDGSIETKFNEPDSFSCIFPNHVYGAVGPYDASVSVTDDAAAKDTAGTTHNVVYLFAEDSGTWLASNTLPTTLDLYGYGPDGIESMQFAISTPPSHGDVDPPTPIGCEYAIHMDAIECEAIFVYRPHSSEPTYQGNDSFTYTVSASGHTSEPATVRLYVDANTKPIANSSTATVLINKPSRFTISAIDNDFSNYNYDELSFHLQTAPQYGTLKMEAHPNSDYIYDSGWNIIGMEWKQILTYTPFAGTTASTDTFTFYVNDTHQNSEEATVTLDLYTPKTLHVNSNDDNTDDAGCDPAHCSLREAIEDALMGDSIDFTFTLPNTITLIQGELLINKNIQIAGPGADQLSISAGFTDPALPENPYEGFRVFHVYNDDEPVEVAISGLTIRDGRSYVGGGVYVNESSSLILNDSVVGPNNIVSDAGGGISANEADIILNNCSVVGNHGTGSEGGAGIYADDSNLTIVNSTISGNVTNNYGGGILAYDDTVVTLIHSTVTANIANQDYAINARGGGGGIFNDGAKIILWNTIVAGNTDLTAPSAHAKWMDVFGTIDSLGGNLIGDDTGSTGWVSSDQVGNPATPINPLLGDLDVHSPGTTPTYPLLEGSPAIDAVTCATGVTSDQRGVPRPQGTKCDIGAFEVENPWKYLFLPLIRR